MASDLNFKNFSAPSLDLNALDRRPQSALCQQIWHYLKSCCTNLQIQKNNPGNADDKKKNNDNHGDEHKNEKECNEGDDKGKEKVKMTTMAMQIDSSAKESFRQLTFVFHFQQRRGSHKIFLFVLKSRSSLKIYICSTHLSSE